MSLVILAIGAFWYLRWRKRGGGNPASDYEKGQPMSPFLSPAKTPLSYYVSPLYFSVPPAYVVDLHGTSFR